MITKFDSLYAGHVDMDDSTPEAVMLEQLEWLAADVMPAFTGRAAVPA